MLKIVTDVFFCLSECDGLSKTLYDGDEVESIDFWLNGGGSQFEFAFDCKKGVGFKQMKWLEKSSKRHQRSHFTFFK